VRVDESMTTIATDGKTIAADGLATRNGNVMVRDRAKIKVERGVQDAIYAMAGPSGMTDRIIKWHRAGADPKEVPPVGADEGWSLLIITPDGCFAAGSGAPYPCQVNLPFAIGSGADLALGAMEVGASPEEAVKAACRRDVHSGGEIQVVNIAEALGIVKPNGASVHEDRRVYAREQGSLAY